MAFKIIRNDIVKVRADSIVNTANPLPKVGSGADSVIYESAGWELLLEERKKIGVIQRGQSAWTPSFKLKSNGVKYIIHTVGTSYNDGKNGEVEILRSCYSSSLNMAKELGCKSVAIPLLGTGNYSFPKELGFKIAAEEINSFLTLNDIEVILVVYDENSYLISERLFDQVQDFLADNYIKNLSNRYAEEDEALINSPVGAAFDNRKIREPKLRKKVKSYRADAIQSYSSSLQMLKPEKEGRAAVIDVEDFINQSEEKMNFQNTLQRLIAERKLENSAVYSKAFVDRKFFSKIISTKDYVPKKMTVMALGLALELPLSDYEAFLASAGYAFMPSSKFDMIIKYCVINKIYNLVEIDMILHSHGESCFAPE